MASRRRRHSAKTPACQGGRMCMHTRSMGWAVGTVALGFTTSTHISPARIAYRSLDMQPQPDCAVGMCSMELRRCSAQGISSSNEATLHHTHDADHALRNWWEAQNIPRHELSHLSLTTASDSMRLAKQVSKLATRHRPKWCTSNCRNGVRMEASISAAPN